ncbi:hypothetical protein GOB07_27415 [Sinorhizobium meliloti]|nr:hypothetical protein SMB554_20965 [Sinorhizobium meliloti]ASQ12527.1 hypothetical protein CDO22_20380 [Sinorhizobium meliloti]MDW9359869.1 hypothetical protein [Sinorhizobium meliloti]MDW9372200.1 hypothetical protein [Sinorhizobium meliloti]MDW9390875.1 hypothetical protein [Sinorhizobium meliloti]
MSRLGETAFCGRRRFGEFFSQSTHRLTACRPKGSHRGNALDRKCNGVDQNGGVATASKRQANPSHHRRHKVLVGLDVDRHERRWHDGQEIGANPELGHQADHEGRETEES